MLLIGADSCASTNQRHLTSPVMSYKHERAFQLVAHLCKHACFWVTQPSSMHLAGMTIQVKKLNTHGGCVGSEQSVWFHSQHGRTNCAPGIRRVQE